MGTVVALESQDGVVIAGDSQAVTEGNVTSKDVDAVVATHDAAGTARLRQVGSKEKSLIPHQ